jgi:hypothetical protein
MDSRGQPISPSLQTSDPCIFPLKTSIREQNATDVVPAIAVLREDRQVSLPPPSRLKNSAARRVSIGSQNLAPNAPRNIQNVPAVGQNRTARAPNHDMRALLGVPSWLVSAWPQPSGNCANPDRRDGCRKQSSRLLSAFERNGSGCRKTSLGEKVGSKTQTASQTTGL